MIDGICHFHPIDQYDLTEIDLETYSKISRIMEQYSKEYLIGMVISWGNYEKIIENKRWPLDNYIKNILNDINEISFFCRIFFPDGENDIVEIKLI